MSSMLLALALVAQPAPDDGPLRTAPMEVDATVATASTEAAPGLDEPVVAPATPTQATRADGPPVAALTFQPRTWVDGETLQVIRGQRAIFRLDDKGLPVLDRVEKGQLAAAHPEGAVTESFLPPPDGHIAIALDGSAEARASVLKIWNQTDRMVDYSAIALVMARGKVTPSPAPVCAVPPRSIRIETWRRPIVAAGLGRFREAVTLRACQ
jgi:hypothetical protein